MRIRFQRKELYSGIAVIACVLVVIITSIAPYQEGNPLGTDSLRRVLRYAAILFALSAACIGIGGKRFHNIDIVAILAVLVFRAYSSFYAYNYTGIGITTIILGVSVCVLSDRIQAKVFKVLLNVMLIVSLLGIICYFSYVFHIPIPFSETARADGLRFINYGVSVLIIDGQGMVRLCGIFDEPGWLGTWVAFCLCAEDLNLKNKRNVILLFAGVLTFSLAFVMLLVIYFFFKNFRDWKRWAVLIASVIAYLVILPKVKTGIAPIDHVIQRMVITSDGLAGDNRSGMHFEIIWNQTIREGKLLWGNGAGYSYLFGTAAGEGIATIRQYIVDFGIIGTVIIFLPLFFASVLHALRRKSMRVLSFVLISFISLYQRPNLFSPPCFIFYLCGISYIAYLEEKENRLELAEISEVGE